MVSKRVIVIGGGVTGCATAHDLTLRGFEVIVVERGDLASGTTGRCSCDQHSGGRYAVKDTESAIECIEENRIARKIMPPGVIVENNGVFILVGDDDESYVDKFFDGCAKSGIEAVEISPQQLLAREPNLTRDIRRAAVVPDAIVEPLRYTMAYAATARVNGARFLTHTEVKGILLQGNRVIGVTVQDRISNEVYKIRGDVVVNAVGPWVAKIAGMAGIDIPLYLSPGIHVIIGARLTHMAINRMRLPGSGDFIAPVRNHSVLGTSSWSIDDCDYVDIREDHIQQMRDECGALVPLAKTLPAIAINAAVRPLLAASGKSERELSRTFECFDHAQRDGIEGFVTISGGKLCTVRAMAERTSDVVCQKLNIKLACQTQTYPLVSYRRFYTG